MGPPGEEWFVVWIVIFVIVLRDFNRQTLGKVSLIFAIQSHAVVFRMSHNKDFTSSLCHCKEQTSLFAFRQDRKVFACMDICNRNFCVSGMRRKKYIIKAPDQRDLTVQYPVLEKSEHFLIQRFFLQAIKMIKTGLRCPTEKDRGSHMLLSPIHDLSQLIPVIHFLKRHLLHRCSCDDHSIKFTFLYIGECFIKLVQMAERCILGFMALHSHKCHIHLQRCIGKRTQKLQLCFFFQRHQIQDQNLDRTDILVHGTFFVHYKYIFSLQDLLYRKIPLCFDRHCLPSLYIKRLL